MKPYIGITMGDPAGVGPEIIVKALSRKNIYSICRPIIIGSIKALKDAMETCDAKMDIIALEDDFEERYMEGQINVLDMDNVDIELLVKGKVSGSCGKAAYEYIEMASQLASIGRLHAIATAPVNKEALKQGGIPYIGHTEILEGLTGVKDPLTMFQVETLRIFFLSRHVALKKACELVTEEKIYNLIKRSNEALARLGIKDPLLAVAGLNPHGGEHGLFGNEEMEEIQPAVDRALSDGFRVAGPIPADSVFHFGLTGRYDAVLSLYHDQGHIAAKMVDFEKTISITNGLPFLRTSVDHGTAFDIAGRGIASEVSMYEAIRLAAEYGRFFVGGSK